MPPHRRFGCLSRRLPPGRFRLAGVGHDDIIPTSRPASWMTWRLPHAMRESSTPSARSVCVLIAATVAAACRHSSYARLGRSPVPTPRALIAPHRHGGRRALCPLVRHSSLARLCQQCHSKAACIAMSIAAYVHTYTYTSGVDTNGTHEIHSSGHPRHRGDRLGEDARLPPSRDRAHQRPALPVEGRRPYRAGHGADARARGADPGGVQSLRQEPGRSAWRPGWSICGGLRSNRQSTWAAAT